MMTQPVPKSFPSYFDANILLNDDTLDASELREYYAELFAPDMYIKTDITQYKTIQGVGEKYTVYVINVVLPFTEYSIEKRYNLFLELYRKIEKNYKNIGLENTTFPSKKIFTSFTQSTIEHRKLHLHKFLKFLCDKYQKEQIVEFLEFLDIKKRLELLQRNNNNTYLDPLSVGDKDMKDIDKAFSYLYLFNKNQKDLVNLFKEFETFFFDTRPKLPKEAIKSLLLGDGELQGLVHLCGKYDFKTQSHLICNAGLGLLLRLLDHETNRDAEIFKYYFCRTTLRDIVCLYFDDHIKGKGVKQPCKISAIKLLHIFLSNNQKISVSQLLSDKETIQEYERWHSTHRTTSVKAEHFVI